MKLVETVETAEAKKAVDADQLTLVCSVGDCFSCPSLFFTCICILISHTDTLGL